MQLTLIKCDVEHLEDLVSLSRKTFKDAFAHLNDPEDFQSYLNSAFSQQALIDELNNENTSFYFTYYGNELAGYFKLNKGNAQTDIKDANSLEIERIYVLKEYQGKNIGQWMIAKIKEIAKNEHFAYLWLGVWEVNKKAIRFYASNGFKKFGEHPYHIGKDKQTDWLMRCDIAIL